MAVIDNAPLPLQDALVDRRGTMVNSWVNFFTNLLTLLGQSAQRVGSASLAGSTSVGATDFSGGVNSGLYRASYEARITTPASVSSTLTVTIAWTEDAVAMSYSGPAITGNTVTSYQSITIPLMKVDGSSPVTYALTYGSVGTSMSYAFRCSLEKVV